MAHTSCPAPSVGACRDLFTTSQFRTALRPSSRYSAVPGRRQQLAVPRSVSDSKGHSFVSHPEELAPHQFPQALGLPEHQAQRAEPLDLAQPAAAEELGLTERDSNPVWAEPGAKRNIVVAIDTSIDSVRAFRWALQNMYRPGDKLIVLHVMPDVFSGPASGSIYYVPPANDPEVERCLWAQAKEFIQDNFVEPGACAGVEVEMVLVKEKHRGIGHAVCRKAEELQASPLILAAHNKGMLERLLMGSTSEFCVAHCKQPVLLLH